MRLREDAGKQPAGRSKLAPTTLPSGDHPPEKPARKRKLMFGKLTEPPEGAALPNAAGRMALADPTKIPPLRVSALTYQNVDIDFFAIPNRTLKKHSESQLTMLMSSLTTFGWVTPVLATRAGEIIAGHGRILAAKKLGAKQVPTIFVDHLTPDEIRAFKIADNKLAELSTWDEEALRDTVLELLEVDFDLHAVGLADVDVDLLLETDEEITAEGRGGSGGKRLRIAIGDIFDVDGHRIMCGDALDAEHCALLMRSDLASMAFLDFPYNVPIKGHVSKKSLHREFHQASGEMSTSEFEDFLTTGLERAAAHCRLGALLYPCMDWRGIIWLLHAAARAKLDYINLAVWIKNRASLGSMYRSQHELVAVLRKPGAQHINNVQLGRNGRHRTNAWHFDTPIGSSAMDDEAVAHHPTPKPWDMIAAAIRDTTRRNDIVIDFYGGSGATLIAAQKTRRKARIMEIDTLYVSSMLQRYQREFNAEATHVETGLTMTELDLQRRAGEGNDDGEA